MLGGIILAGVLLLFGQTEQRSLSLRPTLTADSMALATPTAPVAALPPSPIPNPAATPSPTSLIGGSPVSTPMPLPAHPPDKPASYTYRVINTYPHDRNAFAQGLIFSDGILYEGTGLYGRSSLRRVDLETGQVLQFLPLPPQFFGEGITLFGNQIIQLTWKANTGFVYDKDSFELEKSFGYPTEGWGITHDGERLIMSDGTANLYFWDPETFAEIGRVEVYDNNGPVVRLNELEYINGEVYANVWQTNLIARIDPATGRVLGWIRLDGLLTAEDLSEPVDVLNGIAYDAENDRLFVTGKFWPKLFEIEVAPEE
jgi:glutamine cyclotransferase